MSKYNGIDETEYCQAKRYVEAKEELLIIIKRLTSFALYSNQNNRQICDDVLEFIGAKLVKNSGLDYRAIDRHPNGDWGEFVEDKVFQKAWGILQ